MKRLSIVATAALLVALASSTCFAVNAGQNEVSIFGSIESTKPDKGDSQNSTTVRGGLGHFLTDNVSLGGDALVTYSKASTSGSKATTLIVGNVNAKYHLMPSNTAVPYVGVQAGFLSIDTGGSTGSGFSYGGMGGVSFFMTENASFNAELNYRKDSFKVSGFETKQSTIAGLFGLSYYFGK